MNSSNTAPDNCFLVILESLGFDRKQQPTSPNEGFRIEFEQNFAIEIQPCQQGACRLSARVCKLGHSLQVQEEQLKKALSLLSELQGSVPEYTSLAISNHDNCLRSVVELPNEPPQNQEQMLERLNGFINFAFAYKQTYITFRNQG